MRTVEKRVPLVAAGVVILATLAVGLLVALGGRSVLAGPDAAPASAPPNPGHSWSEIADFPGTIWHSNNDGTGSGLDADLLDGLDSTAFSTGPHTSSLPWTSITSKPPGFADDTDHDTLGGMSGTCADGEIAKWREHRWRCATDDTGAGAFWALAGNAGTAPGTDFLGTTDNQSLELHVNSSRALRLEPNVSSPNVIGGYSGNDVTDGAVGATIGGGGEADPNHNRVTDDYGTVGGGAMNQAGDPTDANTTSQTYATVGGGYENTASYTYATVGGGYENTASSSYATVGGGFSNDAGGHSATVGGGHSNDAGGMYATVPGGYNNTAQGDFSFAAGRQARANNRGCFVWGDSTVADYTCSTDNRFQARANGGVLFDVNNSEWVRIYDDGTDLIDTSANGARLTLAGVWTDGSDAASKENFTAVDGQEVLASVAELPITTWNSNAQDASIRHMGPTAQDFYAAFGLGEDDLHIASLDTGGVALAAIQGLYELSQQQDARIQTLEARVTALEGGAPLERGSESLLSSMMPTGWLLLAGLFVGGLVVAQRRLAGGAR